MCGAGRWTWRGEYPWGWDLVDGIQGAHVGGETTHRHQPGRRTSRRPARDSLGKQTGPGDRVSDRDRLGAGGGQMRGELAQQVLVPGEGEAQLATQP